MADDLCVSWCSLEMWTRNEAIESSQDPAGVPGEVSE
jgi:hypothetical protein